MKYDSGYLDTHTRWVKIDGRNKLKSYYSHRITVRDRRQINKLHGYLSDNFESCTSFWHKWFQAQPTIYYTAETFSCRHYYLNEEDLVKLIIGYVE